VGEVHAAPQRLADLIGLGSHVPPAFLNSDAAVVPDDTNSISPMQFRRTSAFPVSAILSIARDFF